MVRRHRQGGFREPDAPGALSCPSKSHAPSLPWAPFASRAHAEEMASDAAGEPRLEKGRPPGALELSSQPFNRQQDLLTTGMGSHCALAPDPQSGRDEVLAAQPTDRALHDSSLTSPGLQPPSPGYQTASSPLNAVPVLLLQQEGSMAPCASAHGHKGQGAWPSLLPARLLLPLEGIPSCDRDVGFFRKPSFTPPLHPCLALTPGSTVLGSALPDKPGLVICRWTKPPTGHPGRPAQPCPVLSSSWQRRQNRNSAKVTWLLGGGTGIETRKSNVKAVVSALQEEWPPGRRRAGAVEPL